MGFQAPDQHVVQQAQALATQALAGVATQALAMMSPPRLAAVNSRSRTNAFANQAETPAAVDDGLAIPSFRRLVSFVGRSEGFHHFAPADETTFADSETDCKRAERTQSAFNAQNDYGFVWGGQGVAQDTDLGAEDSECDDLDLDLDFSAAASTSVAEQHLAPPTANPFAADQLGFDLCGDGQGSLLGALPQPNNPNHLSIPTADSFMSKSCPSSPRACGPRSPRTHSPFAVASQTASFELPSLDAFEPSLDASLHIRENEPVFTLEPAPALERQLPAPTETTEHKFEKEGKMGDDEEPPAPTKQSFQPQTAVTNAVAIAAKAAKATATKKAKATARATAKAKAASKKAAAAQKKALAAQKRAAKAAKKAAKLAAEKENNKENDELAIATAKALELMNLGTNLTEKEDNEIVCGTYTRAERRAKIARYKAKKERRNFHTVHYSCRKEFADKRPRVGGRFITKVAWEEMKQQAREADAKRAEDMKDKVKMPGGKVTLPKDSPKGTPNKAFPAYEPPSPTTTLKPASASLSVSAALPSAVPAAITMGYLSAKPNTPPQGPRFPISMTARKNDATYTETTTPESRRVTHTQSLSPLYGQPTATTTTENTLRLPGMGLGLAALEEEQKEQGAPLHSMSMRSMDTTAMGQPDSDMFSSCGSSSFKIGFNQPDVQMVQMEDIETTPFSNYA
jgi:hypothetical protein